MTKLLNIIMPWVIPEDVIASGLEGDEGSETNYVYTRPTAGSIWDTPLRVKPHAEEAPSIFIVSLHLHQGAVVANRGSLKALAFSSILLPVSET